METINNPFLNLDNRLSSIESKLDALASIQQPRMEKKYYPISEAAEKLNVATITLYRGVEAGRIPSKRIGSRVMIPGSFVDR